ncbi:MAG: glycosyltransferase family 2 protein [Prolixibacteraceae bacterium]|nr:glycosyltransferase family 2 protein [Prolixibacteraceae bacterium]
MHQALVITPVKDSLKTTTETIHSIKNSKGEFLYCVYNDFSSDETTEVLRSLSEQHRFELVNLSEITNTPSPNYRLVLQMAQKKAISLNLPLIIVESDVDVKPDTLAQLVQHSHRLDSCGMVAAVTTDFDGKINFPYLNFRKTKEKIVRTKHSLSFCCTLLTLDLLKQYDFQELLTDKHWYDVSISRKSIHLGLHNYLLTEHSVLHKPHSSRPWKQLKYTNPVKYYYQKLIKRLDRI